MTTGNQNTDPNEISSSDGTTPRADYPLSDISLPDLWHVAMRADDDDDKRNILQTWHVAADLLDKLKTLAAESIGIGVALPNGCIVRAISHHERESLVLAENMEPGTAQPWIVWKLNPATRAASSTCSGAYFETPAPAVALFREIAAINSEQELVGYEKRQELRAEA